MVGLVAGDGRRLPHIYDIRVDGNRGDCGVYQQPGKALQAG